MKIFNFNEAQQTKLLEQVQAIGKQLLQITFQTPAQDHEMIRHHAYLRGQFDILTQLLDDDFAAPEPQQSQE